MCDKITQILLQHWDTKSTFSLQAVALVRTCVGVCVSVRLVAKFSTTDESGSVATSASTTLTAISHRQLRSPLLQVTNLCDITTTNSSSKRILRGFVVTGLKVWLCGCGIRFVFFVVSHSVRHRTHTDRTNTHSHDRMQALARTHTQAAQFVFVLF